MRNYLNTLLSEKGIALDTMCEVDGDSGINFIPLEIIVDFMCQMSPETQAKAKTNLVKIDFHNGDVMHFVDYVAKVIAK